MKAIVPLAAALCLSLALPAGASVVPRNGYWGGITSTTACLETGCGPTDEQVFFRLSERRAQKMQLAVVVACYNRDTRQTYDRYFNTKISQAGRIGTDLKGSANVAVRDTGASRRGTARLTYDFRGRKAKLLAVLNVSGTFERCNGRTSFTLNGGVR